MNKINNKIEKLLSVIQTMRDACDNAERYTNDENASDMDKAQRVLHELSWGFANASTGIETCFARIEREWKMEKITRFNHEQAK